MKKLKCYFGNHPYRGRYFDVKIYAESRAKAAGLWHSITKGHLNEHTLKTYWHTNPSDETEPKIMVEPYGYSARILFPEKTGWMPVTEAMKVVDSECDRAVNSFSVE